MDRTALAVLVAAFGLTVVAPPRAARSDEWIPLSSFGADEPGTFPEGWHAREEQGREVHRVDEENGEPFLRAESTRTGIQAGLETPQWDVSRYPVLAWSWRPRAFPAGSNERESARNDSALAVYVAAPHSWRGPRALKYIWSAALPVGAELESNHGLTQVRVLRSGGPPGPGEWVDERVNVLEDWQAAFGESEAPEVRGIAVLTDSDDTESSAAGDYADFRACTAP